MMKKKVVYRTNNWVEAMATKKGIDDLNIKLHDKSRAKVKRTKNLMFEVWN